MNWWRSFYWTVALVVFFLTRQSNGLDLGISLCLGLFGRCGQTEKPLVQKAPTDPLPLLQNGFMGFNNTAAVAENIAMDGLLLANKLVSTRPTYAAQVVEQALQNAEDKFYDSGVFVLLSLGKASRLTNDLGRKGLVDACVKLQNTALDVLEEMRAATTLTNQGISLRGKAAAQAITAASKTIQVAFATMYYSIGTSYPHALQAISEAQHVPGQIQEQVTNQQNTRAAAKDNDTAVAISDINKAAEYSINNGASTDKVNRLRELLISSLCDLAQVASHYFSYIQMFAFTDPFLAKKNFLDESKDVNNRIQEICANICLDFGAEVTESDSSFQNKIAKAFLAVEHGNDEITMGNKVAKQLTLLALGFEGNVRSLILNAAIRSAGCGKIALDQRIVEGATVVFNLL